MKTETKVRGMSGEGKEREQWAGRRSYDNCSEEGAGRIDHS